MCLILFAYKTHPDYKLILTANRDEYHNRPASPAAWGNIGRGVLSGRDETAGGTWLGITSGGRFAALTNYRSTQDIKAHGGRSRGALTKDYLTSTVSSADYLKTLADSTDEYKGYNLLFGNIDKLFWFSNRADGYNELKPGIYGLSNHLLDTPWPKLANSKAKLESIISRKFTHTELIEMMTDSTHAPDSELPDTGIGLEGERMLSPIFISTTGYGTRCTTVLTIDSANRASFYEKTYVGDIGCVDSGFVIK